MRAVLRGETATEHKQNLISEIRLSTLEFAFLEEKKKLWSLVSDHINIFVAPNTVV